MIISILGTDYEVIKRKYEEDPYFDKRCVDGYCDSIEKRIVYCDMTTYRGWEGEAEDRAAISEKSTLRHEIVHAFFNESGLNESSCLFEQGWAINEEMIDWIAIQGPKIYKAWQDAEAV